MAMATMLLIPLQWGGNERPWNDPVVIALLVTVSRIQRPLHCLTCFQSAVLLVAFIAWEYKMGDRALMPLNLIISGSIPGACVESVSGPLCQTIATNISPLRR